MAAETESGSGQLLEQDRVKTFLQSDGSLDVLLTRLKQSINTGEELSKFIKKKTQIEDEHYSQLKKFGNQIRMSMKSSLKLKQDSFSRQLDQVIGFDEAAYAVGSQYVKALQVMFDEINSLLVTMTRSRKIIKEEAKRKEKECLDAIMAADKAKQRYYHLCEDLDKLKTSDPNKKSFSLKNKSVSQQEDDLTRKVEVADQDYKQKVTLCKKLKDEILIIHRPNTNKKLKDYILELDIALNVQLQKYATWNENLVMNLGISISPIQSSKPSMKSVVNLIDNEKDLYDYILKNERTSNTKTLVPIDYTVHPSLAKQQIQHKPFLSNQKQDHTNIQPSYQLSHNQHQSNHNANIGNNNNNSNFNKSDFNTYNSNDFSSQASTGTFVSAETTNSIAPSTALNIAPARDRKINPEISNNEFTQSNYTYSTLDPELKGSKSIVHKQPTFGISIEELIQFAGIDNVPLVVKRCIEVIETYGLNIEGIYRTSSNKTTVQQLKDSIDEKFTNYLLIGNNIDPNNVLDADINCIASLLKLYFAELPEPLLTNQYYQSFIDVVKSNDEVAIAKRLHHLVYNLPDGAYFTLRALIFHLNKVADHHENNRMTPKSLAIVWGPAIFNDFSSSPQDLSYKSKVVEELMLIATEIFDTD